MTGSPFIFGPVSVAVSTDDWSKADGAMMADDGEVVPMMDIGTATFVEVATEFSGDSD